MLFEIKMVFQLELEKSYEDISWLGEVGILIYLKATLYTIATSSDYSDQNVLK